MSDIIAHFLKTGPGEYGIYKTPKRMGIYPILCTDALSGRILKDFMGKKFFTFPCFMDGHLFKQAVIKGEEEEMYCKGIMSAIEIALAYRNFVDVDREEDQQAFWERNRTPYLTALRSCQGRFRDPDIHLPEWARLPFVEAWQHWPQQYK